MIEKRKGVEYVMALPDDAKVCISRGRIIVAVPDEHPAIYDLSGKFIMKLLPDALPQT